MKKIVLGLVSFAAIAAPVATVVACGEAGPTTQPQTEGAIRFERRDTDDKTEFIFDAKIKVSSKAISGNDLAAEIVKTIAKVGEPKSGKINVSLELEGSTTISATTGDLSYTLPTDGTSIVGYAWNFAKTVVTKIITEANKVTELNGKVTDIIIPATPRVTIGTTVKGHAVTADTNHTVELEVGTRVTVEDIKRLFIISDEDRNSKGFVISYSGRLSQPHAYLSMLPIGEYHLDMAANNLGGTSGLKRITVKIIASTKPPVALADAQTEVKDMIDHLTKDTLPVHGDKPSDVDEDFIFWKLKIKALHDSMSTEALALFKESDVTVVADDTTDTVTVTISSQGKTKSFTYDHFPTT